MGILFLFFAIAHLMPPWETAYHQKIKRFLTCISKSSYWNIFENISILSKLNQKIRQGAFWTILYKCETAVAVSLLFTSIWLSQFMRLLFLGVGGSKFSILNPLLKKTPMWHTIQNSNLDRFFFNRSWAGLGLARAYGEEGICIFVV